MAEWPSVASRRAYGAHSAIALAARARTRHRYEAARPPSTEQAPPTAPRQRRVRVAV